MSKEAMKLALVALVESRTNNDTMEFHDRKNKAIKALEEGLAELDPVQIEYWLQDTMESGRWITTSTMTRATAKRMLSVEYSQVYPQGRMVEVTMEDL
jgi:hypothetical protein